MSTYEYSNNKAEWGCKGMNGSNDKGLICRHVE